MKSFIAEFGHVHGIIELQVSAPTIEEAFGAAHRKLARLVKDPAEWGLNGIKQEKI